ncbi:MAG: peptidylprolyl isomerase, partial [Terriglobus roseus]|nr:peptidylprolyl isomerase [Terriglobus roseus]
MIRFLQSDNRLTKAIFGVVIGAAIITMVITLVPGIYEGFTGAPQGMYATFREPGLIGRLFGGSENIPTTEVNNLASNLAQRQGYPAQFAQFLQPQAQQILLAGAIEKQEAQRLGLVATDEDVRYDLQHGQLGQLFFPNGQFIGQEKYQQFVTQQIGFPSTQEFEDKLRDELTQRKLVAFVTANAAVSDNAVREEVRQQGMKVKFDYAAITADDVAKSINPTDSELQSFFQKNQARYATAIPEERKITYIPVDASNLPGGKPQVTDADLQTYYNAHQADYHVDEQVKVRHILISAPKGADAKTDAAAKAKAQGILDQIRKGGDFAALAKEYSQDPGSKDSGGELGYVKHNHQMVPEFESAAMALKPGQTSDLVRTDFGYHIIQAEARDEAHEKPLSEVAPEIRPILEQQKSAGALQSFASQLASDAAKNGLDKAAAAHNLHANTTDFIPSGGPVPGLADSNQMLQGAFAQKKGDAPRVAPAGTGEVVVYSTDDIHPAHAPTFAEWKGHVLDDYKAEQVPALLQARLTKLATRAQALHDLRKAAAEQNVPVKTSDLVGRDA